MKKKLLESKKKVLLLALASGLVSTSFTGCEYASNIEIIYSYKVYEKHVNVDNTVSWMLIDDSLESFEVLPEYEGNKRYVIYQEEWNLDKSNKLKMEQN